MKQHKKLWMSIKKNLRLISGKRYHIKRTRKLIYLIDMKNRVDRWIDAFSKYESPQIDFFFAQLKTKNCTCFLDIGSHWGYYSMLIASEKCFKQIPIHAFEPDKLNRYQLYANLFLNNYHDRVTVYDYALSNEDGELRFHHFNENNRGKSHITSDGEITVKAKRLDSVLQIKDEVIGIKIDVEGHEVDAISGMTNILKNNKCILQIESFPEQYSELLSTLVDLGYTQINTIKSDHYFCN